MLDIFVPHSYWLMSKFVFSIHMSVAEVLMLWKCNVSIYNKNKVVPLLITSKAFTSQYTLTMANKQDA